ncbi:MAG TPA: chloride channel protein [Thermoanaerobaculia bacterium]|nr:chloride channel protein [Thermoanaerobaculia bacterium]
MPVGQSIEETESRSALNLVGRARALARRFLIVTLGTTGAFCGVLAVAFERYVESAHDVLIGFAMAQSGLVRVALMLGTPAIVFAVIAVILRRFAPRAVGANLARVRMSYNEDPSLLGPKTVGATFLGTPLSLGAGAPLGPEGPIVVVTSGFSSAIGRMLRLPQKFVRGMIPVGTAAGIAAIFNAPITGVVFALEEIVGAADRGLLGGVLVGAVAAAVVERMLLGGRPLLAAPFSTWSDPRELIGFALLGAISGVVSGAAIGLAHRVKRAWAARMPSMVLRAALAGLIIGAFALLSPSVLGVGYDSISFWLHGGGTAESTAIAFAVKTVVFVIAISGGILGGSFAPSLFIGTALGASVGHIAHALFPAGHIDPKAYAVLGMGSFFAGLLRSPIAAILIVIELTRDYELVLPLMLGVSLAVAISRRISHFSIVEQQMIDEGYVEGRDSTDPLSRVRTRDAMTWNPLTVRETITLTEAAHLVAEHIYRFYPVVDEDGRLTGVLPRETLEKEVAAGGMKLVRDVVEQPKLVARADEDVIEVVRRMQMNGVDRCPVVDDGSAQKVVGFLSPSDILRARISHSVPREEGGFELFE